jgi:hypothetical protein
MKDLTDFLPSQLRVIIREDGGDWAHVRDTEGNLVDQGHVDDVYSHLVETFFDVSYAPDIDRVKG